MIYPLQFNKLSIRYFIDHPFSDIFGQYQVITRKQAFCSAKYKDRALYRCIKLRDVKTCQAPTFFISGALTDLLLYKLCFP